MTLEIFTADSLTPFRHGFFSRRGGASSGVFAGLNCGRGSGDLAHAVSINRGRVADAMDVAPEYLTGVTQIHSSDVHTVNGTNLSDTPRADAMVCNTPGIALAILTADCQPVLFADGENGVVGAAHAGWKGALKGVLEATVNAMLALGAQRTQISAVIGPSISQRAYEVGPEFLDTFVDHDPDNTRFFASGANDHYQFDLPAYGLHRLRHTGIRSAEWSGHCTYSDPGLFFSYRRSVHAKEADYGRLISVIRA